VAGFQNELAAAVGALLLAAHACRGDAGSGRVHWPLAVAPILLAILTVALQTLLGEIRFASDGLLALLYLAGLACAVATGASLTRSKDAAQFEQGFFVVLLAAGMASTGIAFTQWLELGPLPLIEPILPGGRPFGNLVQPNHLATLLCLSMVAAWWLFESRRIGGPTLALVAAWLAIGLVMTRSRTPWVFALVAGLAWTWMRRRAAWRLTDRGLACALLAFVALVVVWGPLSQALAVQAPVSVAERITGGGGRIQFWKALLEGLRSAPWFGYGWTQVSRAALDGSLVHATGESMLRNSHNLVLDLLVWNGIPLGLFFTGAIGWWFVSRAAAARTPGEGLLLLGVAAIAVHAAFEYPLEYVYFLATAGLLVGMIEARRATLREWLAPGWTLALPAAALAGMTFWISAEYLRVQDSSNDNLMVQAGYAREAALPDVMLLDGPREYIRFWRTQARAGMSGQDLEWMRDVVGRNPSPPALLRFALAAGLNARVEESRQTLVRLCNMHKAPRCDEGRQSWAELQQQHAALRAIPYPPTPRL
jgi:O-antigen ligase